MSGDHICNLEDGNDISDRMQREKAVKDKR